MRLIASLRLFSLSPVVGDNTSFLPSSGIWSASMTNEYEEIMDYKCYEMQVDASKRN